MEKEPQGVLKVKCPRHIDPETLRQIPTVIICGEDTYRRASAQNGVIRISHEGSLYYGGIFYYPDIMKSKDDFRKITLVWRAQGPNLVLSQVNESNEHGGTTEWIPKAERYRKCFKRNKAFACILFLLSLLFLVPIVLSMQLHIPFFVFSLYSGISLMGGTLLFTFIATMNLRSVRRIYAQYNLRVAHL